MSFLDAETDIITALKAALPSKVHVLGSDDLAGVSQGNQPTPAVHVLYRSYSVDDQNPAFANIVQTWLTVVAVRNVTDLRHGSSARREVSALIDSVFATLFNAEIQGARMALASAPAHGYNAGHAYFPLAWTLPITLSGANSC